MSQADRHQFEIGHSGDPSFAAQAGVRFSRACDQRDIYRWRRSGQSSFRVFCGGCGCQPPGKSGEPGHHKSGDDKYTFGHDDQSDCHTIRRRSDRSDKQSGNRHVRHRRGDGQRQCSFRAKHHQCYSDSPITVQSGKLAPVEAALDDREVVYRRDCVYVRDK